MVWDDGISGVHREIAASDAQLIAVLAGPGTGKTKYGLMRRVARLLEQGVDPESILLLSFTRTAARDLKDKLIELDIAAAEKVQATTLHSFCLSLLLREDVLPHIQRVPRMLLNHERDLMLRDLDGDWGNIRERREKLLAFEAGWSRRESDHPGLATIPADRAFEREVIQWLRHHKAMLIGEVIPLVFNYLRNDPHNDALSKYRHIVVDEYQDLNYLEQQLIDLLSVNGSTSVCVTGDDDQSIYAFRHAKPDGILRLRQRPGVANYSIEKCGRCPKTVVDMANALIEQAPGRSKPPLQSDGKDGGHIAIVQWRTFQDEIEGIASAIAADLNAERFEPADILVLANRQEIGVGLKQRLLELGIPAHSFFAQEPLKSEAAQYGLALLQLLVKPDPVALRVVLGIGDQTGRAAAYRRLREYASGIKADERGVLDIKVKDGRSIGVIVPSLISRYEDLVHRLRRLQDCPLPVLLDDVFPDGEPDVQEMRAIAFDTLPRAQGIEQLVSMMVNRLTMMDVPENPSYVRIMSLHKSKGLTAKCVYIMGAMQGVLPYLKSTNTEAEDDQAIIEQRRLVYVALTRPTTQLVISYPRSLPAAIASRWGVKRASGSDWPDVQVVPSTYLTELGPAAPTRMQGEVWLASYPNIT
jgi:superfamily I DNA/RNA helicase